MNVIKIGFFKYQMQFRTRLVCHYIPGFVLRPHIHAMSGVNFIQNKLFKLEG